MITGDPTTRGRGLVAAQMALIAALVLRPRRDRWRRRPRGLLRVAGGVLLAAGAVVGGLGARRLGPALTPMPQPRPGATLRTDGVYGVVRHPIYAGLVLGAVGRAATTGLGRHVVAAGALVGVLTLKVRDEEVLLRERFPDYDAYAERTPRLLPGVGARRRPPPA
ncbi:methyltransferase family protein [Georgenia faecalis]|uniref:Methyltransferase family protein n=1 Tax=Georgenia faecalis TaxID=2483799 RepID=A0ABV9D6G7_9MICO|nr:isoprenylcysteine carboxylmethyltransferase family protein [Georgenia faecalis]